MKRGNRKLSIIHKTCPKCNKEGKFGFFDAPDESGTHAMFSHRTGKHETFNDIYGQERIRPEIKHCFVTLDELKKTDWFADWLKIREEENKQYKKEREEFWNKQYVEQYWKDIEKEEELKELQYSKNQD